MVSCSEDFPTRWTEKREKICKKDNYTCVYCGEKFKDSFKDWMTLTVEHVIPYKQLKKEGKGQEKDEKNMRCACRICNNLNTRHVAESKKLLFQERIEEVLEEKKKVILERRKVFEQFYNGCVNPPK